MIAGALWKTALHRDHLPLEDDVLRVGAGGNQNRVPVISRIDAGLDRGVVSRNMNRGSDAQRWDEKDGQKHCGDPCHFFCIPCCYQLCLSRIGIPGLNIQTRILLRQELDLQRIGDSEASWLCPIHIDDLGEKTVGPPPPDTAGTKIMYSGFLFRCQEFSFAQARYPGRFPLLVLRSPADLGQSAVI